MFTCMTPHCLAKGALMQLALMLCCQLYANARGKTELHGVMVFLDG